MGISLTRFLKKVKIRLFGSELPEFAQWHHVFEGKTGLEIGGPSKIFGAKDFLPIYKYVARVDGVNFSAETVWEGQIHEGESYTYTKGKIGHQFIREGHELDVIADNTYDFVLSSHSLEHFANPMKAVAEWKRVLKPGGVLLMVLPDSRYTFDRRRPITEFAHILNDYNNNVPETELAHLEEILSLHDFDLDPLADGADNFRARALKNFENRCLHQHVFSNELLSQILTYFEMDTLLSTFAPPYNIIVMGRKKERTL
ncbi:class I SAM-dependent methyltransferase [uncultured Chitinophaga sp.]|uniref:class I SAM-dependent methyltransferase n=1 Tax=uncultured Chitinophaga sp. TaxID=339340 RepID=UPI0025DB9D48|nr:class I SAM-dependent methyltransferase [uncultured Chitinophaga sp.]